DGLAGSLDVLALAFEGIRFDGERMAAAAGDGLTVATDVAEALVRAGTPFRDAHEQAATSCRRSSGGSPPPARTRGRDVAARRRERGSRPSAAGRDRRQRAGRAVR